MCKCTSLIKNASAVWSVYTWDFCPQHNMRMNSPDLILNMFYIFFNQTVKMRMMNGHQRGDGAWRSVLQKELVLKVRMRRWLRVLRTWRIWRVTRCGSGYPWLPHAWRSTTASRTFCAHMWMSTATMYSRRGSATCAKVNYCGFFYFILSDDSIIIAV